MYRFLRQHYNIFVIYTIAYQLSKREIVRAKVVFMPSKNVRLALEGVQKNVLSGCVIVFSGVIPLQEKPLQAMVWKDAERYGALCKMSIDNTVTHVVANKMGTAKVMQALEDPKIEVVRLEWLLQSIANWQRLPEVNYRLI